MLEQFRHVLTDILLPILAMIGAGVWLRRTFRVDMPTLVKLNLFLFVPAFVFRNIATATLAGETMLGIVFISTLFSAILGAFAYLVGRAAGATWQTTSAVMLATMMYNVGNYGVPLASLAFGDFGENVQAFVLSTQSILVFTVGLALAGSAAGGGWRTSVAKMLRLPILYAIAIAVAWRWAGGNAPANLPLWLDKTTAFLAAGLVPVALVTLGAQLALAPRWPRWRPVGFVVVSRLVLGPMLMAGLVYMAHAMMPGSALDLWPNAAAVVIATAGVPTAVNTLLLTLEMKGDDRLSGDCVFWTTVLSPITICITIAIVQAMLPM